jgi:hypothetical protein
MQVGLLLIGLRGIVTAIRGNIGFGLCLADYDHYDTYDTQDDKGHKTCGYCKDYPYNKQNNPNQC